MSTSRDHKNLKNRIRVALNQRGDCVIWNNEQGYDKEHRVRYGTGKGGSDLIGIVAMPTGAHTFGRFLALEIKTGNARLTALQKQYIQLVRKYGGYATVVRSVEDAENAIDDCREGGYGNRIHP